MYSIDNAKIINFSDKIFKAEFT